MVNSLHALDWCVCLLRCCLSAHAPWDYVWLVSKQADLDLWHVDLLAVDGRSIHGVSVAWGQMSYWGAQVIVSLFSAIPVIGADLAQ